MRYAVNHPGAGYNIVLNNVEEKTVEGGVNGETAFALQLKGDNQYVFIENGGLEYASWDEWEIIAVFRRDQTDDIGVYLLDASVGEWDHYIRIGVEGADSVPTTRIRYGNSTDTHEWTQGFPDDNEFHTFRAVRRANGEHEVWYDGVSQGVSTSTTAKSTIPRDRIGRSGGNSGDFTLKSLTVKTSENGSIAHDYQPTLSEGTGSILPDAVGGRNGTLKSFPTDDSQWIYYQSPDDFAVYTAELNAGSMALTGGQISLEKKAPPFTEDGGSDQPDGPTTLYELDFSLTPASHLYLSNGLGLEARAGENFEFEIQFFFRTNDKNGHSPNVLVAYRTSELITVIFKQDRLDIFGQEIVFGETFSTGQWLTLKLVRQNGQNVECFIQKQGEAWAQSYGSIDYSGAVSWNYIGRRSTAVTDPLQNESDFSLRALKHSVADETVIDFDFAASGADDNDQLTNAIPTPTGAYRYASLVDFPADGSQWVPYELSSPPRMLGIDLRHGVVSYLGNNAATTLIVPEPPLSNAAYALRFGGDNWVTASSLGEILAFDTFRIRSKNVVWQNTGYLWSQAGTGTAYREFGFYRQDNSVKTYVGGVSTLVGEVTTLFPDGVFEGEIELEIDFVNQTGVLTLNGVSHEFAVEIGSNRVEGILFRIGGRAADTDAGSTSGAFLLDNGDQIGDTDIWVNGVLARSYYSDGAGLTWEEISQGADGTLRGSWPSDDSQWVYYERLQSGTPALDMSKGSHINLDGVFRMGASEDHYLVLDFTYDGNVSGLLGDTTSESRVILHADKLILYGVYGESETVNFNTPLQAEQRYSLFIALQYDTLIIEVGDTYTSISFPHDLWFNTLGNDGNTSFISNFAGKLFSLFIGNGQTMEEDFYQVDENSTGNTLTSEYSDSVIRLISFPTDDSHFVMYVEDDTPPVTVTYDIALSEGVVSQYAQMLSGLHQRSLFANGGLTDAYSDDLALRHSRLLSAESCDMNTAIDALNLEYSRVMGANAGLMGYTGSDSALHYSRSLQLGYAVNNLDLANLSLSYGRALALDAGKGRNAYTGYDMTAQYDRVISVGSGDVKQAGYQVNTVYDRALSVKGGNSETKGEKANTYWHRFTRLLSGMNANYGGGMDQHVGRYLSMSSATLINEVHDQQVKYDRALQLAHSGFVAKGENMSFSILAANTYNIELAIGRGFTAGTALKALHDRRLQIDPFTTTLDGATMYVNVDRLLSLDSGDMQSQGSDAAIAVQRLVSLGSGQVGTEGHSTGFAYNPAMQLSAGQTNYAGASISMEVINPLDLNQDAKLVGYKVEFALSPVAITYKTNR